MGIGIRRYIIALSGALPSKVLEEGEMPINIDKGEYPILNSFCREILHLPEKTNISFCTTNKIIPPIEFIGGRETRPPGDTCRMFYKIKREGRTADYFFWDGIVPEGLNELGETIYVDGYGFQTQENIGLATGRTNYRTVLLEKTKRASLKWKALDDDFEE
jgi:hypothetical protein